MTHTTALPVTVRCGFEFDGSKCSAAVNITPALLDPLDAGDPWALEVIAAELAKLQASMLDLGQLRGFTVEQLRWWTTQGRRP